ncbi:hypothetical protein Z517_01864 [Fonsecaea pedrosoi CBS 271.37]|uniref:RING-type domain-containing protein n=1 Tax=Fonsecaea pedrosoi CBS 271.37 TaxID=1442368 RepID=A0A0D2E8K5_9EURO|nr:uncharacterized protein Z517_01864 [Fonsecaea pedrosoi CBS 271.37]KIW86466.1 hypothetical protein Z517_01864 [Fonsecaea pedrosoi CBS 271.37]
MSSGSSYPPTFFSLQPRLLPLPQPVRNSPHDHSRQFPPQPIRRSSPRLFRDFFNAMPDSASRRQATLPRPVPSHQDTFYDVNLNRALENANRAIQTAQEAFQEARIIQTDSEVPVQLPDSTAQTDTSPRRSDGAPSIESQYIPQTTHPHDPHVAYRYTPISNLGEFEYNLPIIPAPLGIWPANPGVYLNRLDPNHPFVDGRLPSVLEEEAINRQRENHQNWVRTQARSSHRRRTEQEQSQSRDLPQVTMSPPSSSLRSTATRSSQHQQPSTPGGETEDPLIESVDLTTVTDADTLSAALAKQRQDTILAQNPGTESGRTALTAYKCPVCMDTPTDATSTACGHVFCHRCILDTLKWSIQSRRENAPTSRKTRGVCPVCRKTLDMKDTAGTGRGLIPLELKLMVKKRKREDSSEEKAREKGKGKGRSLANAEILSDGEGGEIGKESGSRPTKSERETTEDAFWGTFIHEHA